MTALSTSKTTPQTSSAWRPRRSRIAVLAFASVLGGGCFRARFLVVVDTRFRPVPRRVGVRVGMCGDTVSDRRRPANNLRANFARSARLSVPAVRGNGTAAHSLQGGKRAQ